MRLIVTEMAAEDLAAIEDFISLQSPKRALALVARLLRCCEELTTRPAAYPVIRRYRDRGIRRRVYGSYLIIYRATAEAVEILSVVHGARDYEALLFPDADDKL